MLKAICAGFMMAAGLAAAAGASADTRFNVSYPPAMSADPLMGRLIVIVAPAAVETEPGRTRCRVISMSPSSETWNARVRARSRDRCCRNS
jgi:hypothetical protein